MEFFFFYRIVFILIFEKLFSYFGDFGGERFWEIVSLL